MVSHMSVTRLDLHMRWLLRGTAPILVGPWLSEVGFEALYWIPFVHYLRHRYKIPKDRLIAVSRGGAAFWYDVDHHVELFDYVPLKDLRLSQLERHQQTQSLKQMAPTPWEAQLLPLIATRLGLRRYRVLHPSLMYQHFQSWWTAEMGLADCVKHLRFAPMPVLLPPPELQLPERYIAVKFYRRPTWPGTADLDHWTEDLIGRLATKMPIVSLATGLPADDHTDINIPNVPTLAGHVTPQNNLALQSAVIAKAQAFIGTYGGTMQLAVRLGVPAAGFFTQFQGTSHAHLVLTQFLGVNAQRPVFVGRPPDASFIAQILTGIA